MSDAFMMPDAGTTQRMSKTDPAACAGSKLYQAWSAQKADGASRRAAEREYRVLSVLAFIVLLPIVLAMRLLPPRLRGSAYAHRSVFAETRARADAVIPIVFMA
ncbi:hypothetical protein [uncultured Alsobacter sp.]|uniref:hypothetical protein n=1 Tax=uncultured Alsobacter sp. TaxID=1748258 RepID=UPI0025F4AEE3|nr:hypothetical protein [uncultured Alsobacter sp.]